MSLTDDELRSCADGIEACPTPAYALGAARVLRKAADTIADLKRQIPIGWEGALKEQVKLREKAEQENEDLKRRLADSVKQDATDAAERIDTQREIADLKRRLAEQRGNVLDLIRQRDRETEIADEARAEAAALRGLIGEHCQYIDHDYSTGRGIHLDSCRLCELEKAAFSQPGPGAALLERVRRVIEAAASAHNLNPKSDLAKAIAALEEK